MLVFSCFNQEIDEDEEDYPVYEISDDEEPGLRAAAESTNPQNLPLSKFYPFKFSYYTMPLCLLSPSTDNCCMEPNVKRSIKILGNGINGTTVVEFACNRICDGRQSNLLKELQFKGGIQYPAYIINKLDACSNVLLMITSQTHFEQRPSTLVGGKEASLSPEFCHNLHNLRLTNAVGHLTLWMCTDK